MKLKFNNQKFIEQAKVIYGTDAIDECQRLNSKELLHKTIKYADCEYPIFAYKCDKIENALEAICQNAVGNLMIKLIYMNKDLAISPLTIWNNDDIFENKDYAIFLSKVTENPNKNRKDNYFYGKKFTIYLSPNDLSNIKFARYDGRNVICGTPEHLDCVLFHELVHSFHYLIGRNQSKKTEVLDYFYGYSEVKEIWGKFGKPLTDREFSDITGWHYDEKQEKVRFDPINCNMYEACKYCKTLDSRTDLHQRISHKGYADLCKFCQEKNITLQDVLYKIDDIILNLDEWLLEENGCKVD